MLERSEGYNEDSPRGFFDWAERHPGLLILGTLVVAVMLLAHQPVQVQEEMDLAGDETPLFI